MPPTYNLFIMSNPTVLYHGSRFKQTELKPGFLHTGVLVEWDETESNKFLYATSVYNTAMELGFASSIEKAFDVDHFHVDKGIISIQTPDDLKIEQLYNLPVFIYTLQCLDGDCWMKNANEHNGLDTEYKTNRTIRAIEKCEALDIRKWLTNYEVRIERQIAKSANGRGKELVTESIPVYLKW